MARRGFTLVELLVVLSIITLLCGLSASAYVAARRNHRLAATAAHIQTVLRAARNTSIASGTPSYVVVDPVRREVWAQSFETAGEWSFEAAAEGAEQKGGETVEGRVGKGVSFRGAPGHVDCGTAVRFDLRAGVVIEAWVRHALSSAVLPPAAERERKRARLAPRGDRGGGAELFPIVSKEGAYGLALTAGGALAGWIGDHTAVTEDDVVAPERWVFVSLSFDGRALVLSADGVDRPSWPRGHGVDPARRGSRTLPQEIPVSGSPLWISAPEASFPGEIDEVRLRGRVERLAYELPVDHTVVGWKKVIHFDRRGHLDPRFHERAGRFVLVELEPADLDRAAEAARGLERKAGKQRVEGAADFSLTFEEWLENLPGDPPALESSKEERAIEERVYGGARKVVIEVDTLGVVR